MQFDATYLILDIDISEFRQYTNANSFDKNIAYTNT